jgi:hypothetical protein
LEEILMINMKKAALAAAVVMSLGVGAAEAMPIYNFAYNGTFTMLSASGGLVGTDPALTGTMSMDMGTGSGSAAMSPSVPFFGYMWTAHNITLQAYNMTGGVEATMLFDWGVTTNITVTADFQLTPIGPGTFSITTLDCGGPGGVCDGVAGNAMNNGPFSGFNATFGGTATVTSVINTPVPAAVWLLGSGLLGLVGVARRKKSA